MRHPTPEHRQEGADYRDTADVHELHAAIQREKREPRVRIEPLSAWLLLIYALTIFFGGFYLARYGGDFSGSSLDPTSAPLPHQKRQTPIAEGGEQVAEVSPAARGRKIYLANCATCHQASGVGIAGQYPPLAASEHVVGGTRRLGMILLKGLHGPMEVKGVQYGSAIMQPWEKTLTDAKIADVLSFIRSEWGNNAPPVAAEGIAALRKELAGRTESFTDAELRTVAGDADHAEDNAAATADPGAPAIVTVMIRSMKFDPPVLEVKKGDTVEWKNDDITPHTATAPSFDSGSIDAEKSWRNTFTEAGAFPYICTFHPDMKAVVTVRQ